MTWNLDPIHSHVSFSLRLLGVYTLRGRFNMLRGRLHIDEQNPANSWVNAEVETASVDTRLKRRDAHLRTADFFDVETYPLITFRSTMVRHMSGQNYQVTGNLSMHGVSRSISFDVHVQGQSTMRTDLTARTQINRNDFGVGRSMGIRIVAASLVTIEINLVAVPQSAEVPGARATL